MGIYESAAFPPRFRAASVFQHAALGGAIEQYQLCYKARRIPAIKQQHLDHILTIDTHLFKYAIVVRNRVSCQYVSQSVTTTPTTPQPAHSVSR
jgi:hypothetical protein